HIVTIYDVGEDQGMSYIAMEYIDGLSLEDVINSKKRMPLDEVIALVEKVGEALDVAHRKGVVHRDIKPANILLDAEGRPHLVDFGIARISTSTMTQTNMIMGTPYYMSPEQIAGKKVDNRSDIFALGGVLYELLTGQKPFPGDSITTVIYKIMNESPLPMRTFQKNLPSGLEGIVQKALAKDPGARFQSCRALIHDLKNYSAMTVAETLISELAPEAREAAAPAPAARAVRGRKLPLLIGAGVAGLAAVVAAVMIFNRKPPPPPGPEAVSEPVREESAPTAGEVFLNAQALMRDKKWDEALAAFAQIPSGAQEHYEARFLSAEVLFQSGRDSEAERALLGLTEIRRDDSRVYLRLAQVYDRKKQGPQALQFYQTYLSFLPKGPEAEQALKRLTELQREQAAVVAAKAKESPETKKPESKETVPPPAEKPAAKSKPAEQPLKTPAKPPPESVGSKAENVQKKDVEPAAKTEVKKPAALTDAKRAEVKKLTEEGAAHIIRKDYDRAVTTLEQALAVDPGDREARQHLAIARQKKAERDSEAKLKNAGDSLWYRKYDEALQAAREVLAVSPGNEEARKISSQALEGIKKSARGQIEALVRDYAQAVYRGDVAGFFQKNGTSALYQKVIRDMDIIAKQFGGLRVEAFGWSGSVADFQADEARGTLTRLTGEATFKQKMTGVPVGGGGRQTLFDGSILWRLERKEGTWKVAEVVSTPKAQ
ncbi:MAG: tetratricopeptide repeat protein, partial [Candidatus Aminicenantes bacterium]|nr:tetratricopeptide repeat protein [Candidatus Aminicenantes bacterium]